MSYLRSAILAAAMLATLGPGSQPTSAQDKITIGVSLAQDDNPFYIAMLRGIRGRAQELGWDVVTVGQRGQDQANQRCARLGRARGQGNFDLAD